MVGESSAAMRMIGTASEEMRRIAEWLSREGRRCFVIGSSKSEPQLSQVAEAVISRILMPSEDRRIGSTRMTCGIDLPLP
jgi:hypothetical protein